MFSLPCLTGSPILDVLIALTQHCNVLVYLLVSPTDCELLKSGDGILFFFLSLGFGTEWLCDKYLLTK